MFWVTRTDVNPVQLILGLERNQQLKPVRIFIPHGAPFTNKTTHIAGGAILPCDCGCESALSLPEA